MLSSSPPKADRSATLLSRVLNWMILFLIGFAVIETIIAVMLWDLWIGVNASVTMGFLGITFLARRWVQQGRAKAAARLLAVSCWGIDLIGVLLQPAFLPTLTLAPLLSVALLLPYLTGTALRRLLIVTWAITVLISGLGFSINRTSLLPDWLLLVLRLSSLAAILALILLLLWQVHTQMHTNLAQVQAAYHSMQETKARLQTVINHLPIILFALDRDGIVTMFEGASLTVLGLRPSEVIGRPIQELFPDLGAYTVIPRAQDNVAVHEILTLGMSVFDVRLTPHADPTGQWVGTLGIAIDITQQHRLQAQVLQTQKMELVGQLAGGIAHDFNNLLTAISGYTELARDELPPTEPTVANLDTVLMAAERARQLTRQLLAFARKQPFSPQALDLNQQVQLLTPLLQQTLGPTNTLLLHLTSRPLPVYADSSQIDQVLINLAVNARDAMPGGGTLTLTTTTVTWDAQMAQQYGDLVAGAYVHLTLLDTGSGIDATVLAHVFEPFFTTKGPERGSGLGLATCYGIIQRHGGAIAIQSVVGQGTQVTIVLPQAQVADLVEMPPDATALPHGSETVLLVDDEAAVRAVTMRMLERLGYTVREAEHGQVALEVLEATSGTIQIVLSDVVMPHMDGMALQAQIAARWPDIPVVLMSGHTEHLLAHEQAGHVLLQKPFTLAELAHTLRQALDARPGNAAEYEVG